MSAWGEKKLMRALRGNFGYRQQKLAWDAVMPEWRTYLRVVTRARGPGSRRLSEADHTLLNAMVADISADNNRLRRPWHHLVIQTGERRFDNWLRKQGDRLWYAGRYPGSRT